MVAKNTVWQRKTKMLIKLKIFAIFWIYLLSSFSFAAPPTTDSIRLKNKLNNETISYTLSGVMAPPNHKSCPSGKIGIYDECLPDSDF